MTLESDIQVRLFKYIGEPLSPETIADTENDLSAEVGGSNNVSHKQNQTRLNLTAKQYSEPPMAPLTQYPDTQSLEPTEAATVLLNYALFPFLGRRSMRGLTGAIHRAIASDDRLYVDEVLIVDGEIEVKVNSRSLPLIYDGISDYSGNYYYD